MPIAPWLGIFGWQEFILRPEPRTSFHEAWGGGGATEARGGVGAQVHGGCIL